MSSDQHPDASEVGQPLSAAGEGHRGDTDQGGGRSEDARSPESKPHGTLRDQKTTMDSEGPAAVPVEPEDLPATTDGSASERRACGLA